MDLLSHEVAPAKVKAEERPSESAIGERHLSPLAEITAQTATSQLNGSSVRRKPRSSSRRPATASRRKRRTTSDQIVPGQVVVGTLAAINESGRPLVRHPLDPSGRIVLARTTVPIDAGQVDREVVIAFESGDIGKPIVLGVLRRSDGQEPVNPNVVPPSVSRPIVQATVDGVQLVLTAQNEIALRCGKASITLTRAGKVLIKGAYILNRSSGVNRIKGGSVQIN
jgi:hypothetical protein